MANKKNKNWLIYFLLVVVPLLIANLLSDNEVVPVKLTAQSQINTSKKEPKKISIMPYQKTKTAINKINYKAYKVVPHYPTQDVFDESICSIDRLRSDYKPSLKSAINRLNNQYKHYYYNISVHLKLNVYATNMTEYFEKELIERINALHQEYSKMLGESAERDINLNLVITPKRSDYNHYLSFYSVNPIESLGVYFGGLNIAYIDHQSSDDKALKTVIHETVHALNAHIIGKTPRMFNEGMAEFYENMSIKEQGIEINVTTKQLTKEPYPLMQFFDYQQWPSLDIHHLYYSSWAWITFMYGNSNRVQSLISFMKKEQANPCSAFSAGESYEIFQENDNMFEADFYHWQQNLNAH